MARKRVIIHTIERTRMMTPKLPFISLLRRFATSLVSMPNILTKNWASPGLNTIYARKLANTISATNIIASIPLKIVAGGIGSRGFLGAFSGGLGISEFTWFLEASFAVAMILSRSVDFSSGFSWGFIEEYRDIFSIWKEKVESRMLEVYKIPYNQRGFYILFEPVREWGCIGYWKLFIFFSLFFFFFFDDFCRILIFLFFLWCAFFRFCFCFFVLFHRFDWFY